MAKVKQNAAALRALAPWLVPGATVAVQLRKAYPELRRVVSITTKAGNAVINFVTQDGRSSEAGGHTWVATKNGITGGALTIEPYEDQGETWFSVKVSTSGLSVNVGALVNVLLTHFLAKEFKAQGVDPATATDRAAKTVADAAGQRTTAMLAMLYPAIRNRIAAKIRAAHPEIDSATGDELAHLPAKDSLAASRTQGIWAAACPGMDLQVRTGNAHKSWEIKSRVPITVDALASVGLADAIAKPLYSWPQSSPEWADVFYGALRGAVVVARRQLLERERAPWIMAYRLQIAERHGHRVERFVSAPGPRGNDITLAVIRDLSPLAITDVDYWDGRDTPAVTHLPTGAIVFRPTEHVTAMDNTDTVEQAEQRALIRVNALALSVKRLMDQWTPEQREIVSSPTTTSSTRDLIDTLRPMNRALNEWWEKIRARWHTGRPDRPVRALTVGE